MIDLSYQGWVDRRRPRDADISDAEFAARLMKDQKTRESAFTDHMFALGLLLGMGTALVVGPSWLMFGIWLAFFLYYGWKAWT